MAHSPTDTDWLASASADIPDAIAVVEDSGAVVTYAELDDLAARAVGQLGLSFDLVSAGLMGFAPFRVKREPLAAMWATWRLGAAVMPADPEGPALMGGSTGAQERWGVRAFVTDIEISGTPTRAPALTDESLLHTVVLTSGSGGEPRPVRLTHGNVAAAVAASAKRLGNTADDRWLLAMPLHHIGGLSVMWRSVAARGAMVVHDGFDATRAARALLDGSITIASLVPTMLRRILDAEPGPYWEGPTVLLGGAGADPALVEMALDAGLRVLQTYGMTEACSQVSTVAAGQERRSLGTVGTPLDGMEVIAGTDEPAEIMIDGPAVFPGYLGEPDRKGPHPTGDLGMFDSEGRLIVLGRLDDMIVSGGENVYPMAVTEVVCRHPMVERVEVVGVADPEWGQVVAAVVIADPDAREEIEEWARLQLARHQVPKRWVFVEALPLLDNGKVDRNALRDLVASGDPVGEDDTDPTF